MCIRDRAGMLGITVQLSTPGGSRISLVPSQQTAVSEARFLFTMVLVFPLSTEAFSFIATRTHWYGIAALVEFQGAVLVVVVYHPVPMGRAVQCTSALCVAIPRLYPS